MADVEIDNDLLRRSLFQAAFQRGPEASELADLNKVDPSDASAALRNIIAMKDRQSHPTRVTVRFTEKDLATRDMDGFSVILDKADHAVSGYILGSNTYEPHVSRFVSVNVKPGMTVVDIGANVGFFSMMTGSIVGETGKVLAFDPNTENCRLVLLNIEKNGFDWVKLFPLALSNKNGSAFFTPAVGSNGGFLPSNSQTLMSPNCAVIPTMKLDDLVNERVDFIKADIEGAEYLALSGAEKLLRKYRPIIVMEFSMEMINRVSGIKGIDFLKWMSGLGYQGEVLGRNGTANSLIGDIDTFVSEWGSLARMEDIAFRHVGTGGIVSRLRRLFS